MYQQKGIRKKIAGIKAKRSGQSFENTLLHTARAQQIFAYQIPMGCKPIGADHFGRLKYVPVRTACDFALVHNGKTVFLDTKTVKKNTFSFSEITHHQLDFLKQFEAHGLRAGYLIHFQTSNQVCFFSAKTLANLLPRESLSPESGLCLGSLFSFRLIELFK